MVYLFVLGRIVYGGFFLLSGLNQFHSLATLSDDARRKGVPAPQVAVMAAGAINLLGGISVLLGAYPTIGLACIVLFLVPAALFMHNFWSTTDPIAKKDNQVNFGKNLAITGATLMLMLMPQPWPISLGWGF